VTPARRQGFSQVEALEVDPSRVDLHRVRHALNAARAATAAGRDGDAVLLYREPASLSRPLPGSSRSSANALVMPR